MLQFLLNYPFIIYTLLTTSITGAIILVIVHIFRIRTSAVLFRLYLIPLASPFVVAALTKFARPPTAGNNYYIASPIEGFIHAGRLIAFNHIVPVAYLFCLIPFIYFIFRFSLSIFLDKRLLKKATEVTSGQERDSYLLDILESQALRLGIRQPRIYLIDNEIPTSFVFGFYRCGIVISENLLRELDRVSLEALLSHEMIHIARRDTAVMWVALALKSLMFYDPTIHLFFRLIRRERERACDAQTVSLTNKPLALASALFKVFQLGKRANTDRRLYYFNPSNAAFLRGSSQFNNRLNYLLKLGKSGNIETGINRREKFGTIMILLLLSSLFLKSWLPPALPVKCSAWNRYHIAHQGLTTRDKLIY